MMFKNLLATAVLASSLSFVGCNSLPGQAQQQQNIELLQGNTWTLSQIGATEVKPAAEGSRVATLQFDAANKRVSGTDGCNRLMGGYEIKGKQLQFSALASTKMMCMDNMQQANDFNQALAKVTGYQAYGNTLKLLDPNGNVLLTFKTQIAR